MRSATSASRSDPATQPDVGHERLPGSTGLAIPALLLFASGTAALVYQVLWIKQLSLVVGVDVYAVTTGVSAFFAGLALGGALFGRWADRLARPFLLYALLELGVAALGVAATLALARAAQPFAALEERGGPLAWVPLFALVGVPAVLMGGTLPVLIRSRAPQPGYIGAAGGRLYAANTIGGIAGTILTGFVLVPVLGLVRTLEALALAAAAVGLFAVIRGPAARRAHWATLAIGTTTMLAAILTPPDRLASLLPGARSGKLIFYEESRGGTVAVVEQQAGQTRFRRLYIQGVSNSGDAMLSLRYMRLQALLPLVIHGGEPRSALVVGLGTGITAGALLRYPGLERRVCAELLPAVVRAAPLFQGNFGAASDPRIEIRIRDGRRELLRNPQQYDLITLEPPPPSAAGVVNLYSSDFYALAGTRLRQGGLLAQWFPLPTQNDEDSRSLVRSFLDVFPHVSLWTTEFHGMLLDRLFRADRARCAAHRRALRPARGGRSPARGRDRLPGRAAGDVGHGPSRPRALCRWRASGHRRPAPN
jgi:spermidine synthase